MPNRWRVALALLVLIAAVAGLSAQSGRAYGPGKTWWEAGADELFPREERYENPDGLVGVLHSGGGLATRDHPFFQALGSNGRACITCHQPSNGMSVSAAAIRERWAETQGKDAIFAAVDGSNCPDLPQNQRASHSLLLDRGLFRIALPWPPLNVRPEFRIEVVRDPTGCNSNPAMISVFRRPRVAANLKYVSKQTSLMADGREPSLQSQAITAALIHEQAAHPDFEQLQQIVAFESAVFVAQAADVRGGLLNEQGGPEALGPQNVAAGTAAMLNGSVAALSLRAWLDALHERNLGLQRAFRMSAARGRNVFYGRCATCHAAGLTQAMNIGTTNRPLAKALPELPLFKVTCESGGVIYTQDPGRGLITGRCADVGAIVMQQLRGLAARAPYFANGSAATLRDVVDFYDVQFAIGYSEQEKQDLVNFLTVL